MKHKIKYCVLLFILILFLSQQTFPQIHIPAGNVNGKWFKQNSPYFIDGEIKVPYGKKLIIEPGVKIIFTGHYKLIVNGILEAKGTEQDSIYFFPSDTSVGWHGIRFIEAEDFSTLEYCVLMYGKTSKSEELNKLNKMSRRYGKEWPEWLDSHGGAIQINRSNLTINHCLFANNFAARNCGGICYYTSAKPVVKNSTISCNTSALGGGIYIDEFYNKYREQFYKIDIRTINV